MKKRNLAFLNKGKKGNAIADTALIVVVLFAFFLVIVFGKYAMGELNTMVQLDDDLSNTSKEVSNNFDSTIPQTYDSLIVAALLFFWVMAIVASFMVDTHPIFFVISLIAVTFILIAIGFLSNSYTDIMNDATLGAVATQFTVSHWIFTHYLAVAVAIAISIFTSLFLKNKVLG
jgi:hypothetical protein